MHWLWLKWPIQQKGILEIDKWNGFDKLYKRLCIIIITLLQSMVITELKLK